MQQDLTQDEFYANMYSIYRFKLDLKLYSSTEEKAHFETQLQLYEDAFLQVQPATIIQEAARILANNAPTGGAPPPPGF